MGGMPGGRDRANHGAAVADRGAKSLRLRQRGELLAAAGAGRVAAGGNKMGGVLPSDCRKGRQAFHAGLRGVAMAADSARDQKRATPGAVQILTETPTSEIAFERSER